MSTTRPDAVHGRKYRSKKNRPCDLCRKKRMACLREDNMTRCLPCELRKLDCKYVLEPVKKRKRSNETADEAPTAEIIRLDVYTTRPRHLTVSSNQLDQRPRTRNSLELHNGQTSLFVGFSGDQDPWLLSKLCRDHDAPEESDINYDLKNPLNTSVPVIFSVCPTEYLNPRPDRYHVDTIKRVVDPFADKLIERFFCAINPCYPVINRSVFFQDMRSKTLSSTLLASMFIISSPYLEKAQRDALSQKDAQTFQLYDFVLKALSLEQGAATLQTIQALLLKVSSRPLLIRNAIISCFLYA
ncbi:hypothetical protein KL951_002089 [Ogataea haglerorum]|nr:hypothetical protein KL951_002089 [Ogataea haglerorum]